MTQERGAGPALAIVGLLAASLLLALWLGVRWSGEARRHKSAHPQTEGHLVVAGLDARVEIVRDDGGRPRVAALRAVEADAWFGLGFAHAQDRLAQMLWLRRLARGRTAEVVGDAGLPADRLARTLEIGHRADWQAERMPPATSRILAAYAAGVNARLARIESQEVGPPVAMHGWPAPDPWTPGDSLALLKLVSWATGASLETPVVLLELIERLGGLAARPFFPTDGDVQGVGVPVDLTAFAGAAAEAPPRAPMPATDANGGRAPFPLLSAAFLGGSAWVLAADRTAGGAPLLAAELHAPPTAPALVYAAELAAGDWWATGATIPGIPAIWAGRNRAVAWAATPASAVIADLYVETLSPGDRSRYYNGFRWVELRERVEVIRIRRASGMHEETLPIRSTRHGPVVSPLLGRGSEPLSLAWTGARPGDGLSSLLAVSRAADAPAVRAALETHHEPVIALAYADDQGGGGVQVAGWLPRRILPTSLVPVPGRMRAFAWEESVAFEALPHAELGPKRQWVVAADAAWSPPPGTGGEKVEWLWRTGVRSRRFDEVVGALARAGGADLAAAAAVQEDRVATAPREVLPALLELAESGGPLGPEAREVAGLLRGWEGGARADSRAAAAYHLLMEHLTRDLFEPALGELLARYQGLSRGSARRVTEAVVLTAAKGGAPGAWADPDRVRDAVRRSLHQTWASLSYRLGSNREGWSWGRVHRLRFHPLPPLPDRVVVPELGPIATGGDAATVFLADYDAVDPFDVRLASTFRMAADLSSPDAVWSRLAPGQSEHPGHANYRDGLEPWLESDAPPAPPPPAALDPAIEAGDEAAVPELPPAPSEQRLVLEPAR